MSDLKELSFLQDLFEANIKILLMDLDKIIENQDRRDYRETLLNFISLLANDCSKTLEKL